MRKIIIIIVPLLLNTSYSYSEEIITINNDTLYSKEKLKKKIKDSIKENNHLKNNFYLDKLKKNSPNEVDLNKFNTIKKDIIFPKNKIENIKDNKKTEYISIYDILSYSFDNNYSPPYQVVGISVRDKNIYSLPNINNYKKLRSLEVLRCKLNDISSLSYVYDLKDLKTLSFKMNNIINVDKSISNLTSLESLDLSYNKITDLPDSISKLINLKELSLEYQYDNEKYYLTKIPFSIFTLKNLETLDLSRNPIENIPTDIKNLESLKEITIQLNNSDDSELKNSLDNLYNLKSLNTLNLNINRQVEISEKIQNMKNLSSLNLSLGYSHFNNVDFDNSSSFINLSKLSNLRKLVLFNYLLKYPKEISLLKQIKELSIFNSTEKDVSNIKELKNLESLKINGSYSSFPIFINELSNLKKLDVSVTTSLSKPVNDKEFFTKLLELKYLESLRIGIDFGLSSSHYYDFNIPRDIGLLKSLKYLEINNDNLRFLPEEISNLSNLEEIFIVTKNYIRIPDSFKKLKNLKKLHLFNIGSINLYNESEKERIKQILPKTFIYY